MKLILTILIGLGGLFIAGIFVAGLILNSRADSSPEAKEFLNGSYPEPALNGSYAGNHFDGLGKDWLGKQFFASQNNGVNNFRSTSQNTLNQRYEFDTSQQNGLRNKNTKVLLLDYNRPGNPFWLRFIKDEIVKVGEGKYLGKIQLKLGPFVITLGYFRLTQ